MLNSFKTEKNELTALVT